MAKTLRWSRWHSSSPTDLIYRQLWEAAWTQRPRDPSTKLISTDGANHRSVTRRLNTNGIFLPDLRPADGSVAASPAEGHQLHVSHVSKLHKDTLNYYLNNLTQKKTQKNQQLQLSCDCFVLPSELAGCLLFCISYFSKRKFTTILPNALRHSV